MPRLAAALILTLALPALAQEANLSASPSGTPGTAARLALAQRVYDQALESGEVILLLAAIRLARGVTIRPATGWEKTSAAATEPQPTGKPGPDPAGEAALAIAQNMAGDDPDLQDLVYDLDAQLPRGRPELASVAIAILGGGQTDSWRIVFPGEAPAELALLGDGKTPLSLTVTDEAEATVCAAPASPEPTLCQFTPARNGFFTVSIRNAGEGPNAYRLISN